MNPLHYPPNTYQKTRFDCKIQYLIKLRAFLSAKYGKGNKQVKPAMLQNCFNSNPQDSIN